MDDRSSIDDFTCAICKKEFTVPKALPCLNTVCEACEVNLFNNSKVLNDKLFEVKCCICKDNHYFDKKLLPVNKIVQDLMSSRRSIKVFKTKSHEKLHKKIENINNERNETKMALNNFDEKTHNKCEFMKQECELATESLICSINKCKDEFYAQIDSYEKNCIQDKENHYLKFKDNIETYYQKCDLWSKQVDQWEENAKEFINLQKELENAENTIVEIKNSIESSLNSIKQIYFNKTDFNFSKDNFGKLEFEQKSDAKEKNEDLKLQVQFYIDLNYKKYANKYVIYDIIPLYLENMFIIISNVNLRSHYCRFVVAVTLFNVDGTKIAEVCEDEYKGTESKPIVAAANNEFIFVGFINEDGETYVFNLYDQELLLKKSKTVKLEPISAGASDSELYVVNLVNDAPVVHVYNKNLQETRVFGQSQRKRERFYFKQNDILSFKNDRIFSYDKEYVYVFDKEGRQIHNVVVNNANCIFKAITNETFCLFNQKHGILWIFNLKQKLN